MVAQEVAEGIAKPSKGVWLSAVLRWAMPPKSSNASLPLHDAAGPSAPSHPGDKDGSEDGSALIA